VTVPRAYPVCTSLTCHTALVPNDQWLRVLVPCLTKL
jgi:hypothetical protein